MDESVLWADMAAARGAPIGGGPSPGDAAALDWLPRFNEAICEQLSRLWSYHNTVRWQLLDATADGAVQPLAMGRRCDAETCRTRSFRLRLFQVRVTREQERAAIERIVARCDSTPHLYLPGDIVALAQLNRLVGTGSCLLHACVDELCLLAAGAGAATVHIYNRLHTEEVSSPLLQTTVYLCLCHERFHLCDQHCDQTYVGRNGETICALSSMVKRAPESAFTFGDGTARIGDSDVGGQAMSSLAAGTAEELNEARLFGGGTAAPRPEQTRRGNNEAGVFRALGSLVGRRRGRGQGSVVGGAVRSLRNRIALSSIAARSSGDDNAPSAEELAREFAEAARSVANVPLGDAVSVPQEGAARQRKLRRAKRVKATLNGAVTHTKLIVPLAVYRLLNELDSGAEEWSTTTTTTTALSGPRLASESAAEAAFQGEVVAGGEQVLLTLNMRATVPFGECPQRFGDQFVRDMIEEKRMRTQRLARFRSGGGGDNGDAGGFGAGVLFPRYGERACAIFWRLFGSEQRGAIERSKDQRAEERLRISIETYSNERKRAKRALLAEDFSRLALLAREQSVVFQRLVIDDTLWTLIETHAALLVIEFYLNMVSFVQQFSSQFMADVVDAVQTHFYFEHFVPVILFFMRNGLDVNGVSVLPPEHIVVHEWFPETATLRLLGIPEQTMTRLCATVRAYVATAHETRMSMRRLEATQIDTEELMALRVPSGGGDTGAPSLDDSHAFAEHAAGELVRLFIAKRARRLEALSSWNN